MLDSVDAATWHILKRHGLPRIIRPEVRRPVGPFKMPQQDTGCRGFGFDYRVIVDWSPRWTFRTRIGTKVYHGKMVPRPFLI